MAVLRRGEKRAEKPPKKLTAKDMELALATWFDFRVNLIVPNVSHGFFSGREVDLLVMSKAGYLTEVEIKISVADLKRDADKPHRTIDPSSSGRIKQIWFAMPDYMEKAIEHVPSFAGVLLVDQKRYCYVVRRPKQMPGARKMTMEEQFQVARLGAIRCWALKYRLKEAKS